MPVGVPKIAFHLPEEEEATWVDLYNRLYHQRILILGDEVNEETANQLIGLLVYFSLLDNTRDFFFFINSPGGSIIFGLGIFNIMQEVPPEVHTICAGIAASMASFLLIGGSFTKRIALPNAWVMIHQPASDLEECNTGDLVLDAGELLKLHNMIVKVYAQRTGKPFWIIYTDMERDVFMSATEALIYGIIDLIGIDLF
uniref:ATP-dependent Clp protease proteolytic subunit n=1 Tax=Oroxylum indicum TaxID=83951 RepID=A0A6M8PFV1_OROIN|nr:clp protease proteolytic subunit [Oroxylum indicum]QKG62891.1 clp protease proteolytic subunit [Oroxylum indicum]